MSADNVDLEAARANMRALMSPDELAEIDGGLDEDDVAALKGIAGDLDDADDDDYEADAEDEEENESADDEYDSEADADDASDDDDGNTEAKDDDGNKADEAAAAVSAAPEEDSPGRVPSPYVAALPDGFEDRVRALAEADEELLRRLDAGEIEPAEYAREARKIIAESSELDRVRIKAEMAAEMGRQAEMNAWTRDVDAFLRETKLAEGIDYRANEAMAADLDAVVKSLANNPAYGDKPNVWFLEQAHKAVKAMHGVAATVTPPAAKEEAKLVPKTKASRKAPLDKLPKTLADVPGGEGPGDIKDEYADIDALEGEEYERAIAKMTAEQRRRYLASV